jgi:hypothetical protein
MKGPRLSARVIGILVVLGAAGCSHQAARVDCDKHLEAINAPTPKEKGAAAAPDLKPPTTETRTP